jgi:hypothetical protein
MTSPRRQNEAPEHAVQAGLLGLGGGYGAHTVGRTARTVGAYNFGAAKNKYLGSQTGTPDAARALRSARTAQRTMSVGRGISAGGKAAMAGGVGLIGGGLIAAGARNRNKQKLSVKAARWDGDEMDDYTDGFGVQRPDLFAKANLPVKMPLPATRAVRAGMSTRKKLLVGGAIAGGSAGAGAAGAHAYNRRNR